MLFSEKKIYIVGDEDLEYGAKVHFGDTWKQEVDNRELIFLEDNQIILLNNDNLCSSIIEGLILGYIFKGFIDSDFDYKYLNLDSIAVSLISSLEILLNTKLEHLKDDYDLELEEYKACDELKEYLSSNYINGLVLRGLLCPVKKLDLPSHEDDILYYPTDIFLYSMDLFRVSFYEI